VQIGQRLADLETELGALETRRADLEQRIKASAAQLSEIDSTRQVQLDRVAAAQDKYAELQAQAKQHQRQVDALQETVLGLVGRQAEQAHRQKQLKSQESQLHAVHANHEKDQSEARAEWERLKAQLSALRSSMSARRQEIAHLESVAERQRAELSESERLRAEAAERLSAAQLHQALLQDRVDLLGRLEQEGEGHSAGLSALLASRPKGVLGTVAGQIRVPSHLERAIEAALGSKLHNVIVESWSDAEAAISWLKRERAGRVSFLPLDSLRPLPTIAPARLPGIVGLASELVDADDQVRSVVQLLLGRSLIVEDLAAARRLLREGEAQQGWHQAVTLEGDILYGDGRVAGGSAGDGSVLNRERQRRELPSQLQQAIDEAQSAQAALSQAALGRAAAEKVLTATLADLQRLTKNLQGQLAQEPALQRPVDLAEQKEVWYRDLLAQTDTSLQRLGQTQQTLSAEAEEVKARLAEQRTALDRAQQALAAFDASSLQAQLLAARADLARFESQRDGLTVVLSGQEEALSQIIEQISGKQDQREQLAAQNAALEKEIESQLQSATDLTQRLQALTALIEPAEAELREVTVEQDSLERSARALQARQREEELRASKLQLNVDRRQDELVTLHREIDADLGPSKLEASETLAFLQPLLPLGMPAEALPPVTELPEGIEADITRLRRQERRMGTVNPEAPAEYREALQRYRFLTEQADDLEHASRSLREVIAELDLIMRQEFERTFRAVNEQFAKYFVALFDGGSARLELTNGQDPTQAGVEIAVRPPGKRTQGLALLSGGERSLTAIALIFAILKVSPPPFCVLDEVDAMLDEANVGRFRSLLKELSANTQFVVITHNRGTIQAADTIYGVSMGSDSVSQVVSLRLHGERLAD